MKKYNRPLIISEGIIEKTALGCEDFAYYTKMSTPCYEGYLGLGKDFDGCAGLWS